MEEVSVDKFRNERWRDLRRLTDGKSALAHPAFEPGVQVISLSRILCLVFYLLNKILFVE